MIQSRKHTIFLSIAALLSAYASSPYAQTAYPAKPVQVIVGFPAGGSVDVMARNYIAVVFLDRAAFTKRAAEDYRIKAELIKTLDISAQ